MLYDYQNKTIFTKRLMLRLFQTTDAAVVVKLCNNFTIYQNILYLPYPYSSEDAVSWIGHNLENFESNKSFEFAVTDKELGELYGAIGSLAI
ncbi:GNAT family N-acetyltransferase [Alkalihalophilus sp. As8PL]|uniref:GNAT family N-acetyltransferase n=1 Tax=Alkalihalophilus sp. As8PL TaxID=3237103 RepID=A0AB39BVR4_9BACI